jgi:hypothetical protein
VAFDSAYHVLHFVRNFHLRTFQSIRPEADTSPGLLIVSPEKSRNVQAKKLGVRRNPIIKRTTPRTRRQDYLTFFQMLSS